MTAINKILDAFITVLSKHKVLDTEAINKAREEYFDSITFKVSKHTADINDTDYVETTLDAALLKARKPINILVKKNEDGTLESVQIKGLLLKECEDGQIRAYGTRIDGIVRPELPMRFLLLCRANGIKFVKENAVGSGKLVHTELAK